MSVPSVDEILDKLSIKFNKIFHDREFVCCVCEDFQVILENKHKCCVVVFPALGPNYLKAVRYQAKLFDLAVFVLCSTKAHFVAVCHKAFLRSNCSEVNDTVRYRVMFESVTENCADKIRKKRPERQLYVPPAQRKSSSVKEPVQNLSTITRKSKRGSLKTNKNKSGVEKNVDKEIENDPLRDLCVEDFKTELFEFNINFCRFTENDQNCNCSLNINYIHLFWKYRLSINSFVKYFYRCEVSPIKYFYLSYIQNIPIYSYDASLNILNILRGNYVLWQPKYNFIYEKRDNISANSRPYPQFCNELGFGQLDVRLGTLDSTIVPVPVIDCYGIKTYEEVTKNFNYNEFSAFKVLWNSQCCDNSIKDLDVNCGHIMDSKNEFDDLAQCRDLISGVETNKLVSEEKVETEILNVDDTELEKSSEKSATILVNLNETPLEPVKDVGEKIKENNIRNSLTNLKDTVNDIINLNVEKTSIKNYHEQEIEIMRKTKEKINRRTRPIMKYVDASNDTLKIGKNDDNVNNWEDLFDDDGQIQEELFKEITHKVGSDVTIVQAKEDYSEYVKQIEELEHMVELYDFPPTLETHDVIQAFNEVNSDAMYVKWVDDTHAILVLGSSIQAQRAIELNNPLIKVRPMSAASSASLSTAYKNDLKPAMKRPPTNLQTARRLITTHLGTKSRISEEQKVRERNDLKVAKEMKKLARRNEQDAWEGNLRSCVN